MKSFTLSLAIVASTAYAVDVESGGYGHGYSGGYGSIGGHVYGGSPGTGHGYGHGHGHGTGYGGYGHNTVETTHNYAGYGGGHVSKFHPYNDGYHGYGNTAGTAHVNPWYDSATTSTSDTDTTGWWSPY